MFANTSESACAPRSAPARAAVPPPKGADALVDAQSFRSAMSRLGGAVTIITSRDGQERAGLTATAVCSVSAQPPRLLVCVNRDVRAHEVIERSGELVVNVLAAAHEGLARRFAGMVEGVCGEARFQAGEWCDGSGAGPVLRDAAASLECKVVETARSGTHSMFLCEVSQVHVPSLSNSSLIYFDRQFFPISA